MTKSQGRGRHGRLWTVTACLLAAACTGRTQDGGAAAPADDTEPKGPRALVDGAWRASLESPGGPLTFGLELERIPEGGLRAVLLNGEERRPAGRVNAIPGGVVIDIPPYRSRIVAEIESDGRALVGRWERDRGEGYGSLLPFAAVAGGDVPATGAPPAESVDAINGRWAVQFEDDDDLAVGIFNVAANGEARGTFLTTLGDYRYLAGRFDGTRLLLSCFDGAHAFLFSAELTDGSLSGDFWSRNSYHDTWSATKDADAALPDDFALTRWTATDGEAALAGLQFPDLAGDQRSLNDPKFDAPARLLVVFGTWCPNCNDLTELLVELDAQYDGLSILGIAFELGDDPEAHARAVRDYMAHHGADYPVLIGGTMDKAKASAALPVLDKVRAYPTTVFMDSAGNVSAVHTGFSGPATGARHRVLKERFQAEIESLLAGTSASEGR